jgi:FkbM family methyltransferase
VKILNRLWNMSPREFTHAVLRRFGTARDVAARWNTIGAGPLRGAQLFLAPEAVDTWRAMVAGEHDDFLFAAAASCRPLQGAVFWDIGAHIGYHSLAFAALAGPDGRVIAFEPNPANLARLDMHLARNPQLSSRITVTPVAVSEATGHAEFRFSDHIESGLSSGGHLSTACAPNEAASYTMFRSTQVETVSVDELVHVRGLPAPDVMKIDVEGAESGVLRGGRQVISSRRPVLLIEVHHILQMVEVKDLLADFGYGMEVLDREHASPGRCFVLGRPKTNAADP